MTDTERDREAVRHSIRYHEACLDEMKPGLEFHSKALLELEQKLHESKLEEEEEASEDT